MSGMRFPAWCPVSTIISRQRIRPGPVFAHRFFVRRGRTARATVAERATRGWCYGFGAALHDFAAANADRIELRVLSGGLFTGQRALRVAAYPHITGANARIAQLTGVTFGEGYLRTVAEATTVMDSADAAVGLVALPGPPVPSAGTVQSVRGSGRLLGAFQEL